jgi:hypothetical protein
MHSKDVRRLMRREYFRQYAETRRAAHKAEGGRRIDVTLHGDMLDDYESVRQWIERLNRIGIERGFSPLRLSATEVIRIALRHAAASIQEEGQAVSGQGE